MSDKTQFDGKGFDKSPIEGDEAAQHRHMFHEVEENWSTVSDATTVTNAFRIISSIIRYGTPLGVAALGLGAIAKSQGWI